tara:strand:+ start:215 stop:319 length:105 start_codon:yes stop_codon:yes gene_type:complete
MHHPSNNILIIPQTKNPTNVGLDVNLRLFTLRGY